MNPENEVKRTRLAEGTTQPAQSSTETMRAVTYQGKKSVKVSEVPKPLITHPKDVIVKVTACTICSGSDSHIYCGEIQPTEKGSILGHEGCGVITEVGQDVKKFKVGDRVVIAFDIACGECEYCKRGEFTGCDMTNDSQEMKDMYGHAHCAIFGYSKLLGSVPGSQAQYVRVPIADVNCYPIPDDVPDEKALYLSDVLCTSLHAAEMGEVGPGDTVAIWGLGPIGLYTARWCQIKGATRIIGIDSVKERLQLAAHKFGIEVLDRSNMSKDEVIKELQRRCPRGFDVCIEAAGFRFSETLKSKIERAIGLQTDTADILTEIFMVVRKFGRVSIIGDYIGFANHFPIGYIMMKHLTLRSGQCPCQKYFKTVMDHVRDGSVDPTWMITHKITLDEVPDAYDKLHQQKDGYIKVLIKP